MTSRTLTRQMQDKDDLAELDENYTRGVLKGVIVTLIICLVVGAIAAIWAGNVIQDMDADHQSSAMGWREVK